MVHRVGETDKYFRLLGSFLLCNLQSIHVLPYLLFLLSQFIGLGLCLLQKLFSPQVALHSMDGGCNILSYTRHKLYFVIFNSIEGSNLDDSKKLSHSKRVQIFDRIAELELPCAIGIIDHDDIDKMNILRASLMAMRKAVSELSEQPDFVLVDGNHPIPKIEYPQFAIVRGDRRCRSIAAASIIAKVTRDRIMTKMEPLHPNFSFAQHKGYPTPAHLKELKAFGPTDIHRKSFKPVANLLREHALV